MDCVPDREAYSRVGLSHRRGRSRVASAIDEAAGLVEYPGAFGRRTESRRPDDAQVARECAKPVGCRFKAKHDYIRGEGTRSVYLTFDPRPGPHGASDACVLQLDDHWWEWRSPSDTGTCPHGWVFRGGG